MINRNEHIQDLAEGTLDVLVIGGGIVGSGVARDAAMRGLRVGLIDKNDFAFGTSSRSSRLLHGGLRYLAQGRVGLVHEASVEKVTIHKIAPHLAMPLPFIFPTRKGTEWKRWKLTIGVKIYDLLCHGRNLGKSTSMGKEATLRMLPGLNPVNLTGAVRYYDGLTNDARLVLDTLRSAEKNGARCLNYVGFLKGSAPQAGRLNEGGGWECELRDMEKGRDFGVRARVVVNAAGAWADKFAASRVKLRLTKGVHLVVERGRLPVPDAVVMTEGSRILFAIPWGERVILGTTDTDYDGAIDRPGVEGEDIEYILRVTNETFPGAKLTEGDVISSWSGLRPLIADPNGRPSDISRAHQIAMTEPGWIDVAGGKLTTYRLMAEQTVDLAVKHGGMKAERCVTAEVGLLEEKSAPQAGRQTGFSGIVPPGVSEEAVEHFVVNEWCLHLDDLMIRRTSWRHYYREHPAIARRVAGQMAKLLGWSRETTEQEISRYQKSLLFPGADAAAPAGRAVAVAM